jgi:hypothetical protein
MLKLRLKPRLWSRRPDSLDNPIARMREKPKSPIRWASANWGPAPPTGPVGGRLRALRLALAGSPTGFHQLCALSPIGDRPGSRLGHHKLMPWACLGSRPRLLLALAIRSPASVLPRKEVIQPQLPLRLPCYDFVPITSPTFDTCLGLSLERPLAQRLQVLPAFMT